MAYDYTYVPNGNLETGKPARATDIRSIRDMGPAIAEAADGAPRVEPLALGVSPLSRVTLSGTAYTTITGLDRVRQLGIIVYLASTASGASTFEISYSTDGGINWVGAQNFIGSVTTGVALLVDATLDLVDGSCLGTSISSSTGGTSGISFRPSLSPPAGTNAIRFRSVTNGRTGDIITRIMSGRE